MKITTTWNFSHGSNIQRLATTLHGSLSLQFCFFSPLPSLNCRPGTSRFANHNTVGTAFALPSLLCTQTLFHCFLLLFFIICLFWFFPFFSEWKFWGRLVLPVPGERFQAQRGGWGMGGGLRIDSKKLRGKFRFLPDIEGASKQPPCVLYFSWGSMANGARRKLAGPSTQRTSTIHTHTCTQRERSTYSAHYPDPSTTSTDYKPIQSEGLYFPRACCQFGLITLPRLGTWQYKTLRLMLKRNVWLS